MRVATDAKPNAEKRATLLFFTFGDHQDQIIVFGVTDYSPSASEFETGPACGTRDLGRDRQVHGRTRSISEYAEWGWFIHAGVHAAQVSEWEYQWEPCRLGAIATGNEARMAPDCLRLEDGI